MIATSVKTAAFGAKIAKIEKRIVEVIDADMTLSAKRLAFYAMENMLPKSTQGKPWPLEPLKDRIRNDVSLVYPEVGQSNWMGDVYTLIEDNYSKEKANKFWHGYKSGVTGSGRFDADSGGFEMAPFDVNAELAKLRKIPRKIDDKGYSATLKSKSIKRNGARQLPGDTRAQALLRQGSAANYANKRAKRAGLAKTAWYSAALGLGGQVNYRASKFEEGKFVWPSDCVRIHKANPGIGSATKSITIQGGRIKLTNQLRYAKEAEFPGGIQLASERAKRAMEILFDKRMKAKETWSGKAVTA